MTRKQIKVWIWVASVKNIPFKLHMHSPDVGGGYRIEILDIKNDYVMLQAIGA